MTGFEEQAESAHMIEPEQRENVSCMLIAIETFRGPCSLFVFAYTKRPTKQISMEPTSQDHPATVFLTDMYGYRLESLPYDCHSLSNHKACFAALSNNASGCHGLHLDT